VNTWGLLAGLKAVKGNISGGQKKLQTAIGKVQLRTPYGPVHLDKNRQAVIPVYYQQLYLKNGKLAVKTVGYIPGVDQSFGDTFTSKTPAPGRNFPACVKRNLPWIGHTQIPKVTG
jgi:branched-chain amino acid transport system substrate-binding protein